MKIDKLTALFRALNEAPKQNQEIKPKEGENTQASSGEAVEFSSDFGPNAAEVNRTDRLNELKKQVSSGNYSPSSEKVAKAVARELFF